MRWMHCLAIATLGIALGACTTSPTGRSQLTLVSDDQLARMGQQAFAQYRQELPTVADERQDYVQCITGAVVAALPPQERDRNWQVQVFESKQANAFALPGGYVGVNTGMLELTASQDQLAAVIGHEIAHVLANHANERVSTQAATQLGLSALSSTAPLQGPGGEQLMGALGLGARYGIQLPFSRRHESEADVVGLHLMAGAGFDPRTSVALWQNMASNSGAQPPAWMSTHPGHDQRIAGLQAEMERALARYHEARRANRRPDCPRP